MNKTSEGVCLLHVNLQITEEGNASFGLQRAVFYHFEQEGKTKLPTKVNSTQKPSYYLVVEGKI